MLRPGNEHELKSARELLGELRAFIVLADKGYDDDSLRRHIEAEGGMENIPSKANRKNPAFYLKDLGRNRRVVENFFSRIKRHRRINTRYDRLPETFMAFVSLAALADWIRF